MAKDYNEIVYLFHYQLRPQNENGCLIEGGRSVILPIKQLVKIFAAV